MASTIRHNRARGKHQIQEMSEIVISLSKLGWSNIQIAKHLGMEAEEILRLKQQSGVADYYKDRQYSRSWIWKETDNKQETDGIKQDKDLETKRKNTLDVW